MCSSTEMLFPMVFRDRPIKREVLRSESRSELLASDLAQTRQAYYAIRLLLAF